MERITMEQKKQLDDREKRRIFREASNKTISCGQIKSKLNLRVTRQTVWETLRANENIKFMKKKKKPHLKEVHKAKRIEWARNKIGWDEKWKNIVFSDEKKFNLDGPDGFACYWHDLRKDEVVFSKRHTGGGSLMIWGAFSFYGKASLRIITTTMDQYVYQEVLSDHLLPFLDDIPLLAARDAVFMQDNARIHTACSTIEWLKNNQIQVMDWPAYSPDLNPIENVWGILARRVYVNGKQFDTIPELKSAVIDAWDKLTSEDLKPFILSMKNRVADVLIKRRETIDN